MHHPIVGRLREKRSADIGFVALRLVVGCVFIYHGLMKLNGMSGAVSFFRHLGIPMAGFMAPFVSIVEFGGGILLILGLATRLIGLALTINMAVAIMTTMKLKATWAAHELELTLLACSLIFLLVGAGYHSLDAWLMEKSRKEHEDALPAAK